MWKEKARVLCDYIVKHCKVVFPVVIVAAVAVTVTIALNAGNAKEVLPEETTTEAASTSAQEALEQPIGDVPLTENTDSAVYTLIATYYNAVALGDTATIQAVCDEMKDTELLRSQVTSQYIESYPVLEIYTKPGPATGSIIAYVYYKVLFQNHPEEFPGYQAHYICTNENGELYIKKGEISEEENDYIKTVSTQDDVVEFNNRITVEYNELMVQHPELVEYMSELDAQVGKEIGVILAQQTAGDTQTPEGDPAQPAEGSEQTPAEGTEAAPAETPVTEPAVQYATASTTVNVRSSDSEQADKLGKATGGTKLQVLEERVNGWTKVMFEGKEGFIKTEFLQTVENADGAESIGTVTATTNINVRSAASETAERLGVLAGGETVDLISQENGWSKVKYNGQIGYVKSDYVQ